MKATVTGKAVKKPTSRALATRSRIEKAALIEFVENSVAGARTRDIADRAGVSEAAIYRYFESKDALAWALFLRHHTRLADALEKVRASDQPIRRKACAVVEIYCEFADRHWLSFAYHLSSQHDFLERLDKNHSNPVDVIEKIIADGVAKNEVPDCDVALKSAMALGVVLQPAYHRLYGRLKHPMLTVKDDLSMAVWLVLSEGKEKI